MGYNFIDIETKWQKRWSSGQVFKAGSDSTRPKYYALDMFPYPSGSGLHVGHMAAYTPADIVSRYKRAAGFNVLHPMGYDSFGLPAEQYAIQTGIHPTVTTEKAIASFRRTLECFGFSFDWSREISTCDPKYYKWTQFIFLKLMERGLAYQKEVPVNWCPELKTVLANDEVIDGKSERGGHPVIRVPMKQWMLKITDYAERLIQDLDLVDWPERTKEAQRNWIGKSEGARVTFKMENGSPFEVFTTRPDTLFGVSFMVLAPEHPLVAQITTKEQKSVVNDYVAKAASKSEVDRKANTEKSGVSTGAFALHPITGEKIPVWIADYVLVDYGTGAIMAVPGHDDRDFEFAVTYNLPVKFIIETAETAGQTNAAYTGDGVLVNSQFLNGLNKTEAIKKMIAYLTEKKIGQLEVQYKLRDWLFSRQRYWGEPFPVVRFPKAGLQPVPLNELPVTLPEVADYEPSDAGEAPLARNQAWVTYQGHDGIGVDKNGQPEMGRRETDTMPGAAGSSWYYLRYIDPHNDQAPFSPDAEKYWMPVDLYIGGAEHTVGHLLYARFWNKVLFDCGLVTHQEPFQKLAHQGMVLSTNGEKMSKSRGNVVPADQILKTHGADALRTFVSFMGPLDRDKPWSDTGIDGVKRFLDRVWRLVATDEGQLVANDQALPPEIEKLLHKTIKKVTDDINNLSFNTAISAMMILVNDLYKHDSRSKKVLLPMAQLLMPFAPHIAEEIWEKMGGEGLCSLAPWPKYDTKLVADDVVTMGVQVNGKMRGTIEIAVDANEETAVSAAKELAAVSSVLAGKTPDKVIYKAGKILNLIVK